MDAYNETKNIMKKYNIFANKKLGQNFLIDDGVLKDIVVASNIGEDDLVIEIGPGLGTLTKRLLEKAYKVIAIEVDAKMIKILKDRFSEYEKFECINQDILKVDLKKLINKNKEGNIKSVKIVANLPYYITTPIIMKLLEGKLDIDTITVMVQKEVADRLVTNPGEGDTGAITYAINYYTNPKVILQVPKVAFLPMPTVNSTVIKLEVLKKPKIKVENEKMFFKLIKIAFMQKRKTLLNSLTNGKILGRKEDIENMLELLNINPRIRPEKLSLEDFAKLSNYINQKEGEQE